MRPSDRSSLGEAGGAVAAARRAQADVCGRGVGTDVVKKNITGLGGTLEIDSAEGDGMSVKVRLPLTLAIMDGMSVGVGEECYILPLSSVVESFQLQDGMIRTIGSSGRLVQVRDEYVPVLELERVFDVPRFDFERVSAIMVVVEAEGGRVVLLVDELLGQQQVVVKNLEAGYRPCRGRVGCDDHGRRPRRADPERRQPGAQPLPLNQPAVRPPNSHRTGRRASTPVHGAADRIRPEFALVSALQYSCATPTLTKVIRHFRRVRLENPAWISQTPPRWPRPRP